MKHSYTAPEAKSPFLPDCAKSRVILVTGGGSGIGLSIAECFGLHGATVVIMGRRQEILEKACAYLKTKNINCDFFQGDVREEIDGTNAIRLIEQKFHRLDILVNCAAGNFLVVADQLSTRGFKTVIDIDVVGTFNMSRAAFPLLQKSLRDSANATRGTSVIINISATLHYGATYWQVHASAAKAAIDSITRSLALEWGSMGIRVVGIAPGPIAQTAGITKLAPGGDSSQIEEAIGSIIPLGRIGQSNDIALTALFLASTGANHVTGDTIIVDGGHWLSRVPSIPREMVTNISRSVEKSSRGVIGSKL